MKNGEFSSKAFLTTIILAGTVLSCKCVSGSRALDRHQHQQLKDPCRTPTILYGKLQLPDPFHIWMSSAAAHRSDQIWQDDKLEDLSKKLSRSRHAGFGWNSASDL